MSHLLTFPDIEKDEKQELDLAVALLSKHIEMHGIWGIISQKTAPCKPETDILVIAVHNTSGLADRIYQAIKPVIHE
jgi:hypothetical protein